MFALLVGSLGLLSVGRAVWLKKYRAHLQNADDAEVSRLIVEARVLRIARRQRARRGVRREWPSDSRVGHHGPVPRDIRERTGG